MCPAQGGNDDRESMFLPGMEEVAPPASNGDTPRRPESDPTGSITRPSNGRGSEPEIPTNISTEKTQTTNRPMSADANQANLSNTAMRQAGQPPEYVEPLWMRRTKLVIFVMACIYLGIILIILPWNEVWTQNGLIHRYPSLRELAMSYFVRGAITGLGFVNVWLGVWEAVHYREPKR